ncbi:MAG: RimK/LysX family protein [Bacteroidetes bacterium]|nr:RimK/LysX family protein [Bacteroidota bacterium]
MTHKIIGRSETADFPELGLSNIPVKIDTGAYTSSIHYINLQEKEGELLVWFDKLASPIHFKNFKIAKVRSSNGKLQNRYKIKTQMRFFGKKYRIQMTLAKRTRMRFPVLIGRKFLSKKFLVDPSKQNLSGTKNPKTIL